MKKLKFEGYALNSNGLVDIQAPKEDYDNGFYFLSNDSIKFSKNSNIIPPIFLGVANVDWLHAFGMSVYACDNIPHAFAFDNNGRQIRHLFELIEIILKSETRVDFVENLFCVEFREQVRTFLESISGSLLFVPGAAAGQGSFTVSDGTNLDPFAIEREIWRDAKWDKDKFCETYQVNAELEADGIRIYSNVIGGFQDYIATITQINVTEDRPHPFSLRFGSGFLANDIIYQKLRKALSTIPIFICLADVKESLHTLLRFHSYSPMILWMSNLMTGTFLLNDNQFFEHSKAIWSQFRPHGGIPEIDCTVLQDQRTFMEFYHSAGFSLGDYYSANSHTKSFRELVPYLSSKNNLQVTNMQEYIDQDKGESKLPNTRYIHVDTFMSSSNDSISEDTIFLHILMGYGMSADDFIEVFNKSRAIAQRVIVMEHNPESFDFYMSKKQTSQPELIESLKPNKKILIPGNTCMDRNLMYIFDQ
ncbi:MAG: hypothetical protein OQL19_08870 [Gammaproteobacteria bacterium]|nr:hypothetical protein [Gammaproteobacteria bacterium]